MILVTCHCGKSAKQLYIGLHAMTIPTIINMFRACTVQYKKPVTYTILEITNILESSLS